MRTFNDAKAIAKSLRQALKRKNIELSHSEGLELVAAGFGFDDWNVLAARIDAAATVPEAISFGPANPILRIFDVTKAKEFYLDFLGFTLDWEHRFGDNFPLYCQVSRSGLTLHLSEHSGDASPGARVFVRMKGIDALHKELHSKNYRFMKPGIEQQDWGRELTVIDPFSNRICFSE
ncbi:glyoxalase superfamily protein [Phyllobacterium lublinensis]|uniref:glyoxalase superfamily protein n=1 Tax=Phyllobacterium lublinensis TaxID=2875708 RepID=UPI001CCE61C4|nr:glyoxalase superfamily protein [Phyllobacterium sp. 2063]MBZ9657009.1 VOC family protein [Phyllobacterium sp. 2063]